MLTLDFLRDIQVCQNKNGYRFSVDALLIASFVNLPRPRKIADFGAGSGIIGLLLARKYPQAEVTLVELQESLARLAEKNIVLNKLENRVKVMKADIKDLHSRILEKYVIQSQSGRRSEDAEGLIPESFDLIVSNPPYRRIKAGKINPDDEKAIARHEIRLPLQLLTKTGSALLKHHGRLCIIHLPERLSEIISIMKENNLEPKRLRPVHSYLSSDAAMILIEGIKGARADMKIEKPLIIYNEDGNYTDEMDTYYSCD